MAKGFTLLELLIVIAILAILATVTFVVLNPAQLLAQARDAQRVTELGSIRKAISLYLATATSTSLGTTLCDATGYNATLSTASTSFTGTATASTNQTVAGSGWIPVNLTMVSGGSPLSKYPLDPKNTVGSQYGYSYDCSNTNLTFELNAKMESAAYRNGGANDVENTDGGNNANIYEVGSDPGLDL